MIVVMPRLVFQRLMRVRTMTGCMGMCMLICTKNAPCGADGVVKRGEGGHQSGCRQHVNRSGQTRGPVQTEHTRAERISDHPDAADKDQSEHHWHRSRTPLDRSGIREGVEILQDRRRGQEQESFQEGMCDQMEDRSRIGTQPASHEHQPQLGGGRGSKNAFDVGNCLAHGRTVSRVSAPTMVTTAKAIGAMS